MSKIIRATGKLLASELARIAFVEGLRGARKVFLWGLLLVLPLILLWGYQAFSGSENAANALHNLLSLLVFIFISPVVLSFVATQIGARRAVSSAPALAGDVTYEFSDEFIDSHSVVSSSRATWDAVYSVRENKHAFVIYRAKGLMEPIPKRLLSSPAEIAELRELIRSKLGDKAKLL